MNNIQFGIYEIQEKEAIEIAVRNFKTDLTARLKNEANSIIESVVDDVLKKMTVSMERDKRIYPYAGAMTWLIKREE